MEITGVLIPANEETLIRRVDFERGDIAAMQGFVGGLFEAIDFEEPRDTIWCHEEALLVGAPVNRRASLLLWVHSYSHRGATRVRGDVLITGQPDAAGDTTDISQELLEILFFHTSYKYEVKVMGDDNWYDNQRRFGHWSEAYNAVLDLASRWKLVQDLRVLPV